MQDPDIRYCALIYHLVEAASFRSLMEIVQSILHTPHDYYPWLWCHKCSDIHPADGFDGYYWIKAEYYPCMQRIE